jgi:hypothetical protein
LKGCRFSAAKSVGQPVRDGAVKYKDAKDLAFQPRFLNLYKPIHLSEDFHDQ